MTEHYPERSSPATRPDDPSPRRRRKARILLAVSLAVLVVMGTCALGGYLWGHKDLAKTQRQLDRANNNLTEIRHVFVRMRIDLDKAISVLATKNERLQDHNRLLLVRVSDRAAVVPQF